MAVRVSCINKDDGNHENPHVAISYLGWTNPGDGESGKSTRVEMHRWVKDGGEAYVQDAYGNKAYLVAKGVSERQPLRSDSGGWNANR